jgi:hypothetical protein
MTRLILGWGFLFGLWGDLYGDAFDEKRFLIQGIIQISPSETSPDSIAVIVDTKTNKSMVLKVGESVPECTGCTVGAIAPTKVWFQTPSGKKELSHMWPKKTENLEPPPPADEPTPPEPVVGEEIPVDPMPLPSMEGPGGVPSPDSPGGVPSSEGPVKGSVPIVPGMPALPHQGPPSPPVATPPESHDGALNEETPLQEKQDPGTQEEGPPPMPEASSTNPPPESPPAN